MKILVIDTGLDKNYQSTQNKIIRIQKKDSYDKDGHGTNVLSILDKMVSGAEIYIYKILDFTQKSMTSTHLANIIQCLMDTYSPDIINLSLGSLNDENNALRKVVEKANELNIVIVAASENAGAISYPAYYSKTISVSWDPRIIRANDLVFNSGGHTNFSGYGGSFQSIGLDGVSTTVSGSSFIAPLLTAKIVNYEKYWENDEGEKHKTIKILEWFEKENNKKKVFFNKNLPISNNNNFENKKVIFFPLNKEIQTIINNSDMLSCRLIGVYDSKFSPFIGKKLNDFTYRKQNIDVVVRSIDDINWESADFDKVVLGHLSKISDILRFDFLEYFFIKAKMYNKEIFSLDLVSSKLKNMPITENVIDRGSLFSFRSPQIAIVGTKSKIGKADLQLRLLHKFTRIGYQTSLFMTEPYFDIFNQNGWSNGYETNYSNWKSEVWNVNRIMKEIDDTGPELVISSTQSQVLPSTFSNLGTIPQGTQDVLMGIQPDGFILVVSENDTQNEVNRTSEYLRNFYGKPVLALYSVDNCDLETSEIIYHANDIDKLSKVIINFFRKKD